MQTLIDVLSSAAVSAAMAAILVFLSREWISARLRGSIQHEYAEKLETLKAQIKAEHELKILTIRTAFEQEAALRATAHRSFAEGQKAAMERRLAAIDRLWNRILRLRGSLPPIITLIDAFTVEEYKRDQDHPFIQALTGNLSLQQFGSILKLLKEEDGDRTEQARPYVGEYMWSLFYCYEVILIRLMATVSISRDDAAKVEWYKDDLTRQFIVAGLGPGEVQEFDQLSFGRVPWLQSTWESKILSAAQVIVSGEQFGADSLEQARTIQRLAAQAEAEKHRAEATQPTGGA